MLECLLFDLDGLLVDSEPLQFRSYQYALNRFGVSLDHDELAMSGDDYEMVKLTNAA